MKYKEKDGTVLYGFSQENLERTNKVIKKTNNYLLVLIVLFAIFLVILISFLAWIQMNDIVTRLIYKY